MKIRGALVLAILLLGAAAKAPAQSVAGSGSPPAIPGPRPSLPFASVRAADSLTQPTQWKKGAIIGGASLGGAALLLGVGYLAGGSENTSAGDVALATLAGAAIGALLGGLIGGLFAGS